MKKFVVDARLVFEGDDSVTVYNIDDVLKEELKGKFEILMICVDGLIKMQATYKEPIKRIEER